MMLKKALFTLTIISLYSVTFADFIEVPQVYKGDTQDNGNLMNLSATYPEIKQSSAKFQLISLSKEQQLKAKNIAHQYGNGGTTLKKKQQLNLLESANRYYQEASTQNDIWAFYDFNQTPVLNQGAFGTCVTFATSALASYMLSSSADEPGRTNIISPLYTLYDAYEHSGDSTNADKAGDAGWNGSFAKIVLSNLMEHGYYQSSGQDTNEYNQLSQENNNAQIPNATNEQNLETIVNLPDYNNFLQKFKTLQSQEAPEVDLSKRVSWQSITPCQGLSDQCQVLNSEVVKNALDKHEKVLIGVVLYNENEYGDACAYFDKNKQELVENKANCTTEDKNYWTKIYQNDSPAGGHELAVVSYFVNPNNSKDIIFLIRNSWGSHSGGDYGNYYMSANYLNLAANEITVLARK